MIDHPHAYQLSFLVMALSAALVADAAQLIEFAFEEALGCGEHIVLGRLAGGR